MDTLQIRPLTARSVVLSTLLGVHPPRLAARHLVRVGDLFGIAEGTIRVALSRMVTSGDLVQTDGRYALTDRLLERQARQDESRRPRTRPWDGAWEIAVITAERRPAADRAALRQAMSALRLAELREGTWLRPANLDRPRPGTVVRQCTFLEGRPEQDPAALARGYDDLLRTYPDTPAAEEAFLYRTTLLVQTLAPADAERAVDDLTAYLEAHPGARLRTALLTVLSSACETLHRYPDALKAAIAAVEAKEIDPTNPWQTNILEYYRIGMMAQFDVGDFATARTYYRRFLAEYPRDQRAFNVQLLLNHLDDTEARLRAGLPPRELSEIARPATPPAPETRQSATAGAGGGR